MVVRDDGNVHCEAAPGMHISYGCRVFGNVTVVGLLHPEYIISYGCQSIWKCHICEAAAPVNASSSDCQWNDGNVTCYLGMLQYLNAPSPMVVRDDGNVTLLGCGTAGMHSPRGCRVFKYYILLGCHRHQIPLLWLSE